MIGIGKRKALIHQAVEPIKMAILQSQYNSTRLANIEHLKLYYGIGRYISEIANQRLFMLARALYF
jgi:hypothetical protein